MKTDLEPTTNIEVIQPALALKPSIVSLDGPVPVVDSLPIRSLDVLSGSLLMAWIFSPRNKAKCFCR